jgi:hypothetical protein
MTWFPELGPVLTLTVNNPPQQQVQSMPHLHRCRDLVAEMWQICVIIGASAKEMAG